MQDRILTSEQVAQILQIHPFTVLKFIKQGKLKASKLGRVYRIKESEVMKLLNEHEEEKTSEENVNDAPKILKTPRKQKQKQTTQNSSEGNTLDVEPQNLGSVEVSTPIKATEKKQARSNNDHTDHYYILN